MWFYSFLQFFSSSDEDVNVHLKFFCGESSKSDIQKWNSSFLLQEQCYNFRPYMYKCLTKLYLFIFFITIKSCNKIWKYWQ